VISPGPKTMPSGADLRGFVYPLEAVMRQRQWQLDRVRNEWAKSQRATREARQRLSQLDTQHAIAREATVSAWSSRLDASLHRASLGYLARLQSTMQEVRQELQKLVQQQAQARDRYLQQRQRVDAIEHDRSEAATNYAKDRLRQQAIEADRDWLSRETVRLAHGGVVAPRAGDLS
jgi:flagellar export protein FliJ